MVVNRNSKPEPSGGQKKVSEPTQEPVSGAPASGTTAAGSFGGEDVQALLGRINALEKLAVDRAREAQSHTDKSIAQIRKELDETRSRSLPQISPAEALSRTHQMLREGKTQAELDAYLSQAQASQLAYQQEQQRQQVEVLEAERAEQQRREYRDRTISQRCKEFGIDPSDEALDLSSEENFNKTLTKVVVERRDKQHRDELAQLTQRLDGIEGDYKRKLEEHGVLDVLGQGTVVPLPGGDPTQRLNRLNALMRQGKITAEQFSKELANLERI